MEFIYGIMLGFIIGAIFVAPILILKSKQKLTIKENQNQSYLNLIESMIELYPHMSQSELHAHTMKQLEIIKESI